MDAIEQFAIAAQARGLILPPQSVIGDGRGHRCEVEGAKRRRLDGWYLLHLDTPAAGAFENHRDGLGTTTWCAKPDRQLSDQEQRQMRARYEATRRARADEVAERQAQAAKRAAQLWRTARAASDSHPYLQRKCVRAHSIRALGPQLVIPGRDAEGRLRTLQFIAADGSKRFLTGGRKTGCYFALGRPDDTLCIAEGYATAATIFEATGHPVAVAFDAGNLAPVAAALRTKFPALRLVICADNDADTPGNPGLRKATEAARQVGALVAVPEFEPTPA